MNIKRIIFAFAAFFVLILIIWNISQEIRFSNNPLEASFLRFQKLPPEEFHVLWHRKYYDSIYVLDCKTQYNEWNCSVAVWGILIDLGANLDFAPNGEYIHTDKIHELLKFYSYRIKSFKNIKGKEIVVFKPNSKNIPHVAFTERTNHQGKILIMEVAATSGGVNYRWVRFNDSRIVGIYPITLGLWRGK